MMKCPNCGSTAQYREYGKLETEFTIIQTFTCGCGYLHEVFWKKTAEAGYLNNKKISYKKHLTTD